MTYAEFLEPKEYNTTSKEAFRVYMITTKTTLEQNMKYYNNRRECRVLTTEEDETTLKEKQILK